MDMILLCLVTFTSIKVLQEYQTEHRFIPESKLDSYKLDGWDIVMNRFLVKCKILRLEIFYLQAV